MFARAGGRSRPLHMWPSLRWFDKVCRSRDDFPIIVLSVHVPTLEATIGWNDSSGMRGGLCYRILTESRCRNRTLEMTYAYYVCATVIDDETATMCSCLSVYTPFFGSFFLWQSSSHYEAHMVPFVSDQAQSYFWGCC